MVRQSCWNVAGPLSIAADAWKSRVRAFGAFVVAAAICGVSISAGSASAAVGLPDGRAYETVSPPQKNGASLGGFIFGSVPEIANDGSRVLMGTLQCFGGAEACVGVRAKVGSIVSFSRSPAGAGPVGWSPAALTLPATQFAINTYVLASAETGSGVFTAPTPPNGEDHFYVRAFHGPAVDVGPVSPPSGGPGLESLQTLIPASSADLSRLVFQTNVSWPESGQPASHALYEYVRTGSNEPEFVGASASDGPHRHDLISECGTALGGLDGPGESRGAVSNSGSFVYFTAESCASGTGANEKTAVPVNEIYARVDGQPHPTAISEPHAPQVPAEGQEACTTTSCQQNACTSASCQANTCASLSCQENWRAAFFQQSSDDGFKVVFTSAQQLTDAASQDTAPEDREVLCTQTTGPNGCNLYLFDRSLPTGHRLIDLSAGDKGVVGGARVQGVIAVSGDSSHVYFVARGVLTAVPNDRGQSAQEGAENLYVFAQDQSHPEGHTAFIATLPESDPATEDALSAESRKANATPDGRFLVFTNGGALTADVTRTDGAQQVFRYDAETAQLIRISIGQNGYDVNGNGGAGDAYIVPAWQGFHRPGAGRTDPTMSNDGEYVFFMSPVALVPGALESVKIGSTEANTPQYAENVYEYHRGNVSLISDGHDTAAAPPFACEPFLSAVCLLGSDSTGANVFFTTTDQLAPQDTDTELDVYDARICTNDSPCVPPPVATQPCSTGEACQGAATATPSPPTPGSASLSGSGNLPPAALNQTKAKTAAQIRAERLARALGACRKMHARSRREQCEKQARKRYGPLKPSAKKTITARRAK